MMAKKAVWILLFAFLMTTPTYAGESVTFENYLKSFDYQERRNMKIGIPELLGIYKQDRVQIIDIRFREEHQAYSFGFIKHIPLNELPDRFRELDRSKIIVTVCPHYDRAELARTFLTLKGYQSKYLVEGLLGLADYLRGDRAKDFINDMKQ
ncbi:MAG: rhodanese-like domain-containing protein [Deltaproteobacteria bacterium]|nr:rhodanese-like domain-containing protein [Deltaproteobacteria bacterium]